MTSKRFGIKSRIEATAWIKNLIILRPGKMLVLLQYYCIKAIIIDVQGRRYPSPRPPYRVGFEVMSAVVTRTVDVGMKRADERVWLTSDGGRVTGHVIVMHWRPTVGCSLNCRTRLCSWCDLTRSCTAPLHVLWQSVIIIIIINLFG